MNGGFYFALPLEARLENHELKRQEFWSKAIAVGDENWLRSQARLMNKKRFKIAVHDELSYLIGR